MKSGRLPFLLIAGLWFVIVIINFLLWPTLPVPPRLTTIWYCVAGATLLIGPSLIWSSSPTNPREIEEPIHRRTVFIAALVFSGFVVFSIAEFFVAGGASLTGANLAQRRTAYLREGIVFSPIHYGILLAKAAGLMAFIFVCVHRRKLPRWLFLLGIASILMAVVVESMSYGGRAFLRVAGLVTAAAFLVADPTSTVRRWRIIVGGAVVLFLAFVAMVWFNQERSINENEDRIIITWGWEIQHALGLPNPPLIVSYSLGLISGYLIAPVSYFDYFLQHHNLPPAHGLFMFQTIGNRLGFDAAEVKQHVDDYYLGLGIDYNIWATGFREMIVDTGIIGFLPTCLVIGFILVGLQRLVWSNVGAMLLYVLLVAGLLNSPFESIYKNRYAELAITLSTLMFVIIVLRGRAEKQTVVVETKAASLSAGLGRFFR